MEDVLLERKHKKGNGGSNQNINSNNASGQNPKNADTLAREVRDLSLGEGPLRDANESDGARGGGNRGSDGSERSGGQGQNSSSTSANPASSSDQATPRPTLTDFLRENLEVSCVV